MALAGSAVSGVSWPLAARAAGKAKPLGTARQAIMIEMSGAISHMDCWDFKETRWTPRDLEPRRVSSDLYLSQTLFPKLIESEQMKRVSFVRSMRGPELVHFTGQYHVQTGRALNVAVAREIPAFGTIIAAELESKRLDSDTFPTYVSADLSRNRVGAIGSGFFPARWTGMDVDTSVAFDVFGRAEEGTDAELERRWQTLMRLSEVSRTSKSFEDMGYRSFYDIAYRLVSDPRWPKVFKVTEEEKKRYGTKPFGMSCLLARNVLKANAGTRFVYVSDSIGWDHHGYIFDHTKAANHYNSAGIWDQAFTALLEDLASTPGHQPGKSMLDETLLVSTSEFGRTPYINNTAGRDHYKKTFTALLAGGGVKGLRILGKTNEDASNCIDTGWKNRAQPVIDNLVVTIYSALGIDWTKTIENTPSTRPYAYIQAAPIGESEFIATDPLEELFV